MGNNYSRAAEQPGNKASGMSTPNKSSVDNDASTSINIKYESTVQYDPHVKMDKESNQFSGPGKASCCRASSTVAVSTVAAGRTSVEVVARATVSPQEGKPSRSALGATRDSTRVSIYPSMSLEDRQRHNKSSNTRAIPSHLISSPHQLHMMRRA